MSKTDEKVSTEEQKPSLIGGVLRSFYDYHWKRTDVENKFYDYLWENPVKIS